MTAPMECDFGLLRKTDRMCSVTSHAYYPSIDALTLAADKRLCGSLLSIQTSAVVVTVNDYVSSRVCDSGLLANQVNVLSQCKMSTNLILSF